MHSIYRLFKHTYFMFLRSLQDINQPHIKCTENASFIHDNNDDDSNSIVVVIIINDDGDDDFKNEEKVQL